MSSAGTGDKPVLVIAGPGAGKTYDMVSKVLQAIPNLRPNRILAAITYTNAAAESIRRRLSDKINIPENVFVGTNHSFFYRFIFNPYGHLVGDVPREKTVLQADEDGMLRGLRGVKRHIARASIFKSLSKKGIISFDQIVSISAQLLTNKRIREIIGNRVQYLFIDEFQDFNNQQYLIIDEIRKQKKTSIYAVGDPEQYIFSFTTRTKDLNNIAINRFREKCQQVEPINNNHRSYAEIVQFTNKFHTELEQASTKGSNENAGVYFILDAELGRIVRKYREITEVLKNEGKELKRYYLSYENKTIESHAKEYGLMPIANDLTRPQGILSKALELIGMTVRSNKRKICERYGLDNIQYRRLGIELLKAINDGEVKEAADLSGYMVDTLGLEIEDRLPVRIEDEYRKVKNFLYKRESEGSLYVDQYSSIHRVKGLEADAVLVVAESVNRLKKWLVTEKEERYRDKRDECRIGFVAFSRAKSILCIACLEKVDKGLEEELLRLGARVVKE